MMLSFYMDEHIHGAITIGLRYRNVNVLTIQEDGRMGIADTLILDRATELNRVVFSQDQDFLAEANRRQVEGIYFCGVVYAHQRVVTIGDCVRDLEIIAKICTVEDMMNLVQFLPL